MKYKRHIVYVDYLVSKSTTVADEMNKNGLMGFHLNQQPLPKILDQLGSILNRDEKADATIKQYVMACANPHSLAQTRHDKQFTEALHNAEFLIADGVGITLAEKALRTSTLSPRITGHNFFCGVNTLCNQKPQKNGHALRVFFFGSSDHVLGLIKTKFEKEFPLIELCGLLSPPYGEWTEDENQAMVDTINAAKPDVLWVGMTAPKQEKWVFHNRDKLNAKVIGNIGAVFDFYAETYPRAPEWACRLGMEWLVRLVKEPKRLWRRTFISAPTFLILCLRTTVIPPNIN